MILKNHASALIRKERWSPTSKPSNNLIVPAHCLCVDFHHHRNHYCELPIKLHTRLLSQRILHTVGEKLINGSLQNTSTDSKRATFVILKNHASVPIRKERLSPTGKARREASQNEFVKKVGVPDGLGLLNPSEID